MSDEGQWCDPGYCQLAEVSNYAKELKEKLAECLERNALLEARLGKAVEALGRIARQPDYRLPSPQGIAQEALAEIKGESHE